MILHIDDEIANWVHVVRCNGCKALVLKQDYPDHEAWHDRNGRPHQVALERRDAGPLMAARIIEERLRRQLNAATALIDYLWDRRDGCPEDPACHVCSEQERLYRAYEEA